MLVGHVDDGSHCDYDSGACVSGICLDMPDYVPGTKPPTTVKTSVVVGNTTTRPATTETKEFSIPTKTTKPTPSPTLKSKYTSYLYILTYTH